jgi:hypothetical protein
MRNKIHSYNSKVVRDICIAQLSCVSGDCEATDSRAQFESIKGDIRTVEDRIQWQCVQSLRKLASELAEQRMQAKARFR